MKKSTQEIVRRTCGRGTDGSASPNRDDTLYGTTGNDLINAGGGNNTIIGGLTPKQQTAELASVYFRSVLYARERCEAANDAEGRMVA